jgi:hypothetical protein
LGFCEGKKSTDNLTVWQPVAEQSLLQWAIGLFVLEKGTASQLAEKL